MHPHAELIDAFYNAFQRRDGEAMARCYHPNVHFSDPVFPDLKGSQAGAMWKMLTARKDSDLDVSHSRVRADDRCGSARWEARYSFPDNAGRKVRNRVEAHFEFEDGKIIRHVDVRNRVEAHFEFEDGKIIRHVDRFNLYRWTRMAMGPVGTVFGFLPIFQNAVRKKARIRLEKFST